MVETAAPRPVAGWYMIAAIASLLFMMLGCVGLIMHVMTDPAALPLDQRALFEAEPKWVLAASAVGFLAGAVGALMLVLRRKVAERELFISLIAMLVWARRDVRDPSVQGSSVNRADRGPDRGDRARLDDLLVRASFAPARLAAVALTLAQDADPACGRHAVGRAERHCSRAGAGFVIGWVGSGEGEQRKCKQDRKAEVAKPLAIGH